MHAHRYDHVTASRAPALVAPTAVALAAIGLIATAALLGTLFLNGGTFTYTLDDPYIHLALSENIARGHYGINMGEASSPSSSILFPFLLAPAAGTDLHAYVPLLLNAVATIGLVALLFALARRCGLDGAPRGARYGSALVVTAVVAFNGVGVAFTGMEHSLHIAVSVAVVLGLVHVFEAGRVPWWLVAAMIAGPLLRYEGLGISSGALLVLLALGHYRAALGTALALAVTIGAFTAFLVGQGLPPVPSSTLTKSTLLAAGNERHGAGALAAITKNVSSALSRSPGRLLLGLAALIVARPIVVRSFNRRSPAVLLAGFALTLTAAHLVAGRYGWQSRYELYALFALLAAALYQWRDVLVRCIEKAPRGRLGLRDRHTWALALLPIAILILGLPYLRTTVRAPLAANNIYEQQYQMHRFATAFHRGPVAVNDLGWVAYRNPSYVLDLAGLGSEAARRALMTGTSREAFDVLARRHDVTLAMVYPFVDRVIPAEWMPLARLHLSRRSLVVAAPTVVFYATRADAVPVLQARLDAFATTLPPGVRLERQASPD